MANTFLAALPANMKAGSRDKKKLSGNSMIPDMLDGPIRVTSGKGFRKNPMRHKSDGSTGKLFSNHKGLDIGAAKGTKISFPMDAKVKRVREDKGGYGKHVIFEVGDARVTIAHLDSISVQEEQEIKAGTVVGTVGSTGNSQGPHSHIDVKVDGEYKDPRSFFKEN